jgi:hypothetical protein
MPCSDARARAQASIVKQVLSFARERRPSGAGARGQVAAGELRSATAGYACPLALLLPQVEGALVERRRAAMGGGVVRQITLVSVIRAYGPNETPQGEQ